MIYTAITNKYDEPRTDVKCFTDYSRFKDPRMNAKIYKVLPHLFMPNEEWHIWVDGNLELKVSEDELIALAGDSDIAVFENPYRTTVQEEIEEVKRLGLDDEKNLENQYRKDALLSACFLIIKKNTPEMQLRSLEWFSEIMTKSIRDQISFPYCFPNAKRLPKVHPFDNQYFKRKGHLKPRA